MHGELVAMCVVAISTLQANDPEWARDIVVRSGVAANPADLDIDHDDFVGALLSLSKYVEAERLDCSIVDAAAIDGPAAERLWDAVRSLPRL